MKSREIFPGQVKRIKQLCKALGIDDETYRLMLSGYKTDKGKVVESCTELSYMQAAELILKLSGQALGNYTPSQWAKERVQEEIEERATAPAGMLKRLYYHAIACAIHYTPFDRPWKLGDGTQIEGDELRQWLQRRFDAMHKGTALGKVDTPIPKPILRAMYNLWINPTANRWLYEGHYREQSGDPASCYFGDMQKREAMYLINRFKKMQQALSERPSKAPSTIKPNQFQGVRT